MNWTTEEVGKWGSSSKYDSAISQSFNFVKNDVKKNCAEFHNFDKATDRPDFLYLQNSCFKIKKGKKNFEFCFEIDF